MSARIIDQISEALDTEEARNEWDFLVQPLANALLAEVRTAPGQLYVDAPMTTSPVFDAAPLPADWDARFEALVAEPNSPIILLGYPGVGKTSWLERFAFFLSQQQSVTFFYYNQHHEDVSPVGKHISEPSRTRCRLAMRLLQTVRAAMD